MSVGFEIELYSHAFPYEVDTRDSLGKPLDSRAYLVVNTTG